MADKRAIKVETLDRLGASFQESRGITDKLTIEQMIELAKVPTASGENKLALLVDGTLTEITAADLAGIESIKNYAFCYASHIKTIEFPNTLKTIGYEAFYNCSGLTGINLPEGLETILNSAFYQSRNLTGDIVLPNTLTSFGSNVFAYTGITSVVVSKRLTELPYNAFYECRSLKTVTLPSTITTIGSQGFAYCNIKTITLPASIISLGNSCFYECHALRTVTILSVTPPTIGTNVFKGASGLEKIIVPKGSGDAYKAATNWSEWADFIEEATE